MSKKTLIRISIFFFIIIIGIFGVIFLTKDDTHTQDQLETMSDEELEELIDRIAEAEKELEKSDQEQNDFLGGQEYVDPGFEGNPNDLPGDPQDGPEPVGGDEGFYVELGTGQRISGTVEEVNTGCFADGECYVVVDGMHITTLIGWSRDVVGGVYGVDGVGDIPVGAKIEGVVYQYPDGKYTLYGNQDFYLRIVE